MNTRFSQEDETFRETIVDWLAENLSGEFAALRGRGGPGDDHALIDERKAWERRLGEAGWIGIGLPASVGGRGPAPQSTGDLLRGIRSGQRAGAHGAYR